MEDAKTFNDRRALIFHLGKNDLNMETVEQEHERSSMLFSENFMATLYNELLARNTHVIANSLFLVKIQYLDDTLWLVHTGEEYNPKFSVMNAIAFVYDNFQDKLTFVQVEAARHFLRKIPLQRPYYVRTILVRDTRLDLGRIEYLPEDISSFSSSFEEEKDSIFSSEGLYNSAFFYYLLHRNILTPVSNKNDTLLSAILRSVSLAHTSSLGGDLAETTHAFFTIVQNSDRTGYFIKPEFAFESPPTNFISGERVTVSKAVTRDNVQVERGSPFTTKTLKKTMNDACRILRSLGVAVNVIDNNIYLVFEALVEAAFVHECVFGPTKVTGDARHPTYSYVAPLYDFEADADSAYTKHRVRTFERNAAWILATKILVLHECKTARVYGFFKGIHDAVASFYQLVQRDGELFANRSALRKAIFAALFWESGAVNAHKEHLIYPGILTNAPLVFPALFHVGFFLVHQMAAYLTVNARHYADPLPLTIKCSGFCAMSFEKRVWTFTAFNGMQELTDLVDARPPLKEDDWSSIDEALLNEPLPPTLNDAINSSAPTVIFGNVKLRIERLGDAMRRVFLSSFPEGFFGGDAREVYSKPLLKRMKKGPVGSIANLLLKLRDLTDDASKVKKVKKEMISVAMPKAAINQDYDKKNVNGMVGAPYAVSISDTMGSVSKGASLYVLTKKLSVPLPVAVGNADLSSTVLGFMRKKMATLGKLLNLKEARQISSLEPSDAVEKTLLEDVLLVVWFLHSPFFSRTPYAKRQNVAQGDPVNGKLTSMAVSRLPVGAFFQFAEAVTHTVKRDYISFNKFPLYIDGIVATRQHGVIAATGSPNVPVLSNTGYLERSKKVDTKGNTYVGALLKKVTGLGDLANMDGVTEMSVLFPEKSTGKRENAYKLGMRFLDNSANFVITATSRQQTAWSTGLQTSRLFENESLSVVKESRSVELTQDTYLGWSLMRQAFDRAYANKYFVTTAGSMILRKEDEFKRFSATQDLSNRTLLYDLRRSSVPASEGLENYNRTITGAMGPLFRHFVFERLSVLHKTEYAALAAISSLKEEYLKGEYVAEIHNFADIHNEFRVSRPLRDDLLTDFPLANQSILSVKAGRSPVATFAFHEASKLDGDKKALSPLEVFRIVAALGLSADVPRATLENPENFPLAPGFPVSGKEERAKYELSISARTAWSPNEFYGEIIGYVTRGNDYPATLEENLRGNDLVHYASSATMRAPHVVQKKLGETGLVPVYDMSVAIYDPSTKVLQREKKWEYGQWKGLRFNGNDDNMTRCTKDLVRKQWALHPAFHFVPGNVVGILAGEVNAIELVTESVDIFDPGMPGAADVSVQALDFSIVVRDHVENIFSSSTLYPVGEYEWFQCTDVIRRSTVPHHQSNADAESKLRIRRPDGTSVEATPANLELLGPHAYRERIIVHGYQISGTRFSSRVRYVRYTHNPALANAVFVEVPRKGLAAYGDEPALSYWALTATKEIPHDMEIVVAIPAASAGRIDWRKFLLGGYPREIGSRKTRARPGTKHGDGIYEQGYDWGLPVRLVSNYRTALFSQLNDHFFTTDISSSLPITAPRTLTVAQESFMHGLYQRNLNLPRVASVPFSQHVDAMLKFDLDSSLEELTRTINAKRVEVSRLDKAMSSFPNTLISAYGTAAMTGIIDDFYFDVSVPSSTPEETSQTESATSTTPYSSSSELAPQFVDMAPYYPPLPTLSPVSPQSFDFTNPLPELDLEDDLGAEEEEQETFPLPVSYGQTYITGSSSGTNEETSWVSSRRHF